MGIEYEYKEMPKNVRQVGMLDEDYPIFMEDYVATYLTRLALPSQMYVRGAILLGEICETDKGRTVFVKGAIEATNLELDLSQTTFTDEIWEELEKRKERYFPQLSVVGWFFTRIGFSVALNSKIEKVHKENFPGEYKILYMADSLEEEEAFYISISEQLIRTKGYYIYYEKNEPMKEYLLHQKMLTDGVLQEKAQSEKNRAEKEDRAVINYRKIQQKRAEGRRKNRRKKGEGKRLEGKWITYASAFLMMCIIGAAISRLGDYSLLDQFRNKTEETSNTIDAKKEEKNTVVKTEVVTEESTDTKKIQENRETTEALTEETLNQNTSLETIDNNTENTTENEMPSTIQNDMENETENATQSTIKNETEETMENANTAHDYAQEDEIGVSQEETAKQDDQDVAIGDESVVTGGTIGQYYIVKKGDTLAEISRELFGSMDYSEEIARMNGLEDENKIYEGQKLMIPNIE